MDLNKRSVFGNALVRCLFLGFIVATSAQICKADLTNPQHLSGVYKHDGYVLGAGTRHEGRAFFFYSHDDVLDKPVIIVEGFDPLNKSPSGNTPASVEQDVFESAGGRMSSLVNKLRADGYDVVYIDFLNNTGSIQGNAGVVIDALNKINREKKGLYTNTVIGMSMGGVVAKYALLHMEDNGLSHDVNAYVSYDAPHLCANIPPALYVALEALHGGFTAQGLTFDPAMSLVEGAISYGLKKSIASIAALQMGCVDYSSLQIDSPMAQVYSHAYGWGGLDNGILLQNVLHDELEDMGGLPRGPRNIGFANGGLGSQNFSAGSSLFSLEAEVSFSHLVEVWEWITPCLVPDPNPLNDDCELTADPVYEVVSDEIENESATVTLASGPATWLDRLPGGHYNFPEQLCTQINPVLDVDFDTLLSGAGDYEILWNEPASLNLECDPGPPHAFVPTVSSLMLSSDIDVIPAGELYGDISDLVANSPFEKVYYTEALYNEKHMFFSTSKVNDLETEIHNNQRFKMEVLMPSLSRLLN